MGVDTYCKRTFNPITQDYDVYLKMNDLYRFEVRKREETKMLNKIFEDEMNERREKKDSIYKLDKKYNESVA